MMNDCKRVLLSPEGGENAFAEGQESKGREERKEKKREGQEGMAGQGDNFPATNDTRTEARLGVSGFIYPCCLNFCSYSSGLLSV